MRKTAIIISIGFFFLAGLSAVAGAAPFQAPPPRPLTLHAAQGAGAPTDVPGINKIDVVLTLSFEGPVRRTDVDDVALKGGGVSVPPQVLKAAKWDAPESRVLSLAIPLEDLLHAGISYDTGTTVLSLECELTMRGGAAFVSRVQFDIGDPAGATSPFKSITRAPKSKPEPPSGNPAASPQAGRISIIVTKPNPEKHGPFDDAPLAVPMAGAKVSIDFERDGQHVHIDEVTPDKGDIRVEVPLDVPVTLKWEKESRTVTCTAKAASQMVVFSTLKLKTVSTAPIKK
jgi:hypothetical protein